MPNPFTYCELHTPNTAAAKTFYTRLFGWSMNDLATPGGTYTEIKPGEGIEGGLMAENGEAPYWLTYVRVADVAKTVDAARGLGAKLLAERREIPDVGWIAVLADPTGARFAVFQPAPSR
ncbi:MAG TPA: VOC family protein [Thermoanaerobaculia bacterium]|nr:VOC family protein [Thermoanaerobaculia bacterium]